jgi:hypothetical protein
MIMMLALRHPAPGRPAPALAGVEGNEALTPCGVELEAVMDYPFVRASLAEKSGSETTHQVG